MVRDTIEEYPTVKDIEVALKKIGRIDTQEFIRDNSSLFIHTKSETNVANTGKHLFYDLDSLVKLKKELDGQNRKEKSTAFVVETPASLSELEGDLGDLKKDDEVFHEDSGLTITRTQRTDHELKVKVDYIHRKESNRNLLNAVDRSATFRMTDTHEDDIFKVTQDFYNADQFSAVKTFFEDWDRRRQINGDTKVARADIRLTEIGNMTDRVDFVDDFLDYEPGNWDTRNVCHLGVRQADSDDDGIEEISDGGAEEFEDLEDKSELEEQIDQQLSNISQLALDGDSLRSNPIVKKCLKNNFYFDSANIYCVDTDNAKGVEIQLKFKENGRNAFDLTIEQEYEVHDGDREDDDFSPSFRHKTRKEFRDAVVDLFSQYKNMPHLMKEAGESYGLEDLPEVGPTKADNFRDAGYDSVAKVLDASVEELAEVNEVGETTAKIILGEEA
ncbi:helix-hairpin-helix domain-containing protein [Natrinema altunense]|uniref:Helix-hairpin-helix domain-containing protein n=1 Tax=Natrinema altunense TaxID=222984 RepID=A0A482XYY6_9EURY|nr:helix-hairpin-helix domain-containing protein [Natrinema altunense]RZH69248.1 hypothetical protein ELS17_07375 [Natrinema altunense]